MTNQARFVQMIIDGELIVSKKKKTVLVGELKEKGFKAFPKVADAAKAGETEKVVEEGSEDETSDEPADSQNLASAYDYLLGMAIWSLTQERVERLRRQIGDKEYEIDELIKLSKEDIWLRDLDDFINEWRYQLSETDRRRRGYEKKGRRTSTKLAMGGGKAAGAKKRKAADDSDDDFVVSKSKKKPAAKKAEPQGGLMSFLNKKPKTTDKGSDSESDDEFDMKEIIPKKSRGPAKVSPQPKDEDPDVNMADSDIEIIPQKSRAAPKAAPKPKDEDDEDVKPKAAPKRGRAAAAAKPTPKDDDSDVLDDDDFKEITKAEAAKSAPQSRTGRGKAAPKYALSDSESDNGDDLLGDVSKMVKGIGGANDSRQLFSEPSRPGSSTGLPTSSKTSKFSNEFDPDETDYSKLIPQNSPRRSLQVKPKEKASDSVLEDDEEEEPAKPAKGKAAPKTKAAAAPKATAGKGRGRPKKDAAAPSTTKAPTKQTTLSPAAKAYASKQAKAAPKKKTIMDDSEDDIDAMANDILDSPAGVKDEASARSNARSAASTSSRPSRRTATTKKSYVVEDDDSDDGQDDSFDMSE